ncbi:MAG TPA: hypothetical protein VFY87_22855 [Geminicoccaceae bacterium]|nr:hypothetical protein [Geminicoccaceae bacterium]
MSGNEDPTPLQFHIVEVEFLRKEIESRSIDQRELERNVVVLLIGIYAALGTLAASDVSTELRDAIPPFLVISGNRHGVRFSKISR